MKLFAIALFVLAPFASYSQDDSEKKDKWDVEMLIAKFWSLEGRSGGDNEEKARAYFHNMSDGYADSLDALLRAHLRQLELDEHDPKKHFEAECQHSLGVCEIRNDIETSSETIMYMFRVREK